MARQSFRIKHIQLLLSALLVAVLLAGCAAPAAPAPAAETAAATEAAAAEATTEAAADSGTTAGDKTPVVFWQFSTDEPQIAAYQKAIDEFEKLHPEIDVQMEIVPWSSQQQALTTGLTTGELPDVSMLGNNVVAQYQAIGALLPLTDYFQKWSEEAGSDVTADFWPGDTYYYKIGNDWWGSPVGVETRNLWYRTDLLEAAGLAHHFGFGGYGCDSTDRAELVAVAIAKSGVGAGDTAVVVGDTIHDVAAARACGAKVVAVTTGADDRATLEAAGADVVFDGLAPLCAWHQATFAA